MMWACLTRWSCWKPQDTWVGAGRAWRGIIEVDISLQYTWLGWEESLSRLSAYLYSEYGMHGFLSQFLGIIELVGRQLQGEWGPSGWLLSRGRGAQPACPAMIHFSLSLTIHLYEKSQRTHLKNSWWLKRLLVENWKLLITTWIGTYSWGGGDFYCHIGGTMNDNWDRSILVTVARPAKVGFCSDGEGFIFDFERLLQSFCLSLTCLRRKRRRRREAGWRLWEWEIDLSLCPFEYGRLEGGDDEKMVGVPMLWVGALLVNILYRPNTWLQRSDSLWGRFEGDI